LIDFINKIIEAVEQGTGQTHTINLKLIIVPNQIIADEKLLRKILIDLLSNAIKFSTGQVRILFSISNNNSILEFTIQDFGLGISEDEYDKIKVADKIFYISLVIIC